MSIRGGSPFAHTYSIVARDPHSGQFGAAVQSHWFSVGSVVPWAQAGVGVVATQAMVEMSYGPLGLELMSAGKSSTQALTALLAADNGRDLRQVAMVDAAGQVAAHTGSRCLSEAGHFVGDGFSVQANMMLKPTVWPAMAKAYQNSTGDLAERLLAALEAAQAEGGDIRGQQSACIKIVSGELTTAPWSGVLVDLRVEDHPEPVVELRRLVQIQRGYQFMNLGDEYLGKDEIEKALEAYRAAGKYAGHIAEVPFWYAVTLVNVGRVEEALPIFQRVFAEEPNWSELLVRMQATDLFQTSPETLAKILACVPKK